MIKLSDVVPDTATEELPQIGILDKLHKLPDSWKRFKKEKKKRKKKKKKREEIVMTYILLRRRRETLIRLLDNDDELCKNFAQCQDQNPVIPGE